MHSTASPIVKCSSPGDLTDVIITEQLLSQIVCPNSLRLYCHILLKLMMTTIITSLVYQFSLEKNHSTASCAHVLKQTVNHYYVQRGSHVFCAFIDFNKAFDNVDYWLSSCKLINNMFVRWQGCVSTAFTVSNGVCQGGILSPFLFRFYVRNIIASITGLKYSWYFYFMYADDMVLLAPLWNALQSMLSNLEYTAHSLNMTFNTKKPFVWFLPARRYVSAGYRDRNVSVRPSVCPSRAGIVSKRRKLAA